MINQRYVDLHGSGWPTTPATLKMTSPEVSGVVTQIEQMSQQEQLLALRDLLTGGSSPLHLNTSLWILTGWLCGIS